MPTVPGPNINTRDVDRSPVLGPKPSETNLLMAAAEMDRLGAFTQPSDQTGPVTQPSKKRPRKR